MTALTLIQKAAARLAITSPSIVFTSTNDEVIQLRNLMNQEGIELATGSSADYVWRSLTKEKTFTTVAQAIQTSAVSTDFGWYIPETLWNRTTDVPGYGPVSSQEWQYWQAYSGIALPNFGFRFRGEDLLFYPSPTAGQTIAYEYSSKAWAETAAGADLQAMTADTDVAKLDENLIVLGVVWRFLQAKGLDYAEAFRTYQIQVQKAMSRDGFGKRRLRLHGGQALRHRGNIPDGGWSL